MSNIDKQDVQAIADLKAGYTLGHADVAILNELARIALASIEAEPVGYFGRFDADDEDLIDQCSHNISGAFPLYTAPPAPVSVPEWTNEQCLEFLSIAFRHAEIKGDLELDDIRLGVKMVNGSRAAMLQGAEPVTTAYKLPFEQWLSQQTGTIDVECGCVMTEVFFHWLRVAYEAGNSPVVPDGLNIRAVAALREAVRNQWLKSDGLADKVYWKSMHDIANEIVSAMLAAAPQQEVKNG
ncbi:hypothetical protein [Enterobacter hormaechei]|uniref:hypothetical protein n=1 Tax=Enterobacter hormaechei TaxID=158836 RepID=UPI000792E077|nr:hypothetical protein [Enterobacter hormaechei]CZW29368.1 Uncharacterised protein [Enterobacter hormaechei]